MSVYFYKLEIKKSPWVRIQSNKGDVWVLSHFSCVQLFTILWTGACQAPLSMGFSKQEYWSGLPCPPPEDLPSPGNKPALLMSPVSAGGFFTTGTTWEAHIRVINLTKRYFAIMQICNLPRRMNSLAPCSTLH